VRNAWRLLSRQMFRKALTVGHARCSRVVCFLRWGEAAAAEAGRARGNRENRGVKVGPWLRSHAPAFEIGDLLHALVGRSVAGNSRRSVVGC